MFSILQNSNDDCGLAVLRTLLANAHRSSRYLYIQDENHKGPYSYLQLIQLAGVYGVTLKGYHFKTLEDLKAEKNKNLAIVTIKSANYSHAVVICKIKKKKVLVFDPGVGIKTYKKEDFLEHWDKTALLVEEVSKQNPKFKAPKLVETKYIVLATSLQLVSSVLFIVGTLFLNENYELYLPITAFAVAFIFDLLFRSTSFKLLARIDKNAKSLKLANNDEFKEYATRLENYKKVFIENLTSFSSSFLIVVFIIALLILNDLSNLYLVLLVFLIAAVKVIFLNKKEELFKNELKSDEAKMHCLTNVSKKLDCYDLLHTKAYRYGYLKYFEEVFSSFIIVLALLILMLLKAALTFQTLIFYFFLLETCKKNLVNIFQRPNKIAVYRNKKTSLLDVALIKNKDSGSKK